MERMINLLKNIIYQNKNNFAKKDKGMKQLFKIFLAMFFMLTLSNAQTLKIGTSANFPPFEYIDTNSTITGFDIDLIDTLSKKIGFEYEIVNMSFDGLIPALKSGKIDMIAAGMSATEQRKKAVDFTDSYYLTKNVFIKNKANDKINSKDDLKGKSIGTQLGTVQEIAIRELKNVKVVTMKDPVTVILALKNTKLDVAVFDSSVAYGYIKENDDIVAFYTEADGSEGFSFAFNKDKNSDLITKINATLLEIKEDGTYDKILEKYNLK